MKNKIIMEFGIPIVILACLTVLIGTTNADVSIMQLLYSPQTGWLYGQVTIWKLLCDYGHYPALIIAAVGLVLFVLGYFKSALVKYRVIGLFLALNMIIGPGLIVNCVFKDHWGRPRPIDTQQFGGNNQFHQLWEMGIPKNGRSFPSGQASTGFFFFAFYFLLRDRARKTAIFFFHFAVVYGLLIGMARMAQGAHYPGDVLWAGGMVYLTGTSLYYLLHVYSPKASVEMAPEPSSVL